MQRPAVVVRRWVLLALIPFLSVCSGDPVVAPQPDTPSSPETSAPPVTQSPPETSPQPVATQLLIDPVESEGLTVGHTLSADQSDLVRGGLQLTATVLDQFGATMSDPTITWTSSHKQVATATNKGLVTTRGLGETTITATIGALSASVLVTTTQYAELTLITDYGNLEENSVVTDEIFAVWWHKNYDLAADATALLADLVEIRHEARDLGLWDPPNPGQGAFYNVYLHDPGARDDNYPDSWANRQETDRFGRPFLTLPLGDHRDQLNVSHEAFHMFTYSNVSGGFHNHGDSRWYNEATANWYAARRAPTDVRAFVESSAIHANPQLTAWHSFDNEPPGDPRNWQRQVHQYAMNSLLYYLTEVEQVPSAYIVDGFYANTSQSPQEYLYRNIDDLRSYFGNWAAHNVADFDYLTREQWNYGLPGVLYNGDPDDINPYVATYTDSGTEGAWAEPEESLTTRGWSYNVIHINNTQAASYTIDLEGTPTGSEGAGAYFQARVVVRSGTGDTFHTISLPDGLTGSLTITATAADHTVYLVVAAVPEHFFGNQIYPYRYKITRNSDG